GPPLHIDHSVLQGLLADSDTNRDPDQVGVGELLTRPQVTVVQKDLRARLGKCRRGLVSLLFGPGKYHDMNIVGSDARRPDNSLLVVALLDDRGNDPLEPDAVAAHDQRQRLPVLVEERRLEWDREPRVELEDVTDLDRGLEQQLAAAVRARVALTRSPQ